MDAAANTQSYPITRDAAAAAAAAAVVAEKLPEQCNGQGCGALELLVEQEEVEMRMMIR